MNSIKLRSVASNGALFVAALFAQTLPQAVCADDINNFNAGNIDGWGSFDIGQILKASHVPGTYTHYNFPSDGNGGKALQITTTSLPAFIGSQAGPPRAFAFPTTAYTRFEVQADVLTWNNTNDQAFGFLFLASNIGPGQTDGYVLNYNVRGANLQINVVTGESPGQNSIGETHLPMDPTKHTYRWELSGYDGNFLGRIFQFPDTQNPIGSVIANDSTSTAGVVGLFNFDRADPPYLGTDSTFDNYHAWAPSPGTLAAVPVFLTPVPGDSVPLAQPLISIAVLDRETSSDRSSFTIAIDGVLAPSDQVSLSEGVNAPNNPAPFGGVTVSYTPANPLSPGNHQVTGIYADNIGNRFTNSWQFTAAYLANPVVGTPGESGFNLFIVQAPQNPQLPNSLAIADAQLATNSTIPRLSSTNVVVPYINFDIRSFGGNSVSQFGNDLPFPGQTDTTTVLNWAMLVNAYVQLPAGLVTMGVKHDDGFRVSYGDVILGQYDGGTGDHQFSFYVGQAGLYPLTLEWNQSGGGAYVYWYQVTPNEHDDTGNEVLLNTLDGFAAYTSVITPPQLLASSSVLGPLTPVSNAVYDPSTLSFTVPLAGAGPGHFYRVSAPGRGNIVQARIVGGNLVIHYIPAP